MSPKPECEAAEPPFSGEASQRVAQFVRLLSSIERRLYSYVVAMVGNLADADEIVQETNLRLWEQFDQFRPDGDFGSWACSIAYYQVLSFRKRMSRNNLRVSDEFFSVVAAELSAREEELDARQHALGDCLGKLPPADRDLVLKCYSGQSTIEQVANSIGRSVAGTYQALWRIRNTLRRCIEQRAQWLLGGGQ